MTLRKSILLFIGLGMIAALMACSSSSHTTTTVPTIAATSGGGQSATVGTAFANPLVATVTLNGSPSSGASVTFTAPSSGASCVFTTSGTNTETDTANTSGVATSSVCTANTTAGAYNVSASTTGATTAASFALTNTAGAAAAIAATGGNNQSVAPGATFATLTAQVTDGSSNGVSGVAVTFTANTGGTGATGTFTSTSSNTETVNTDANGNATVSDLVANATTGAFTVTADFAGDTGSPASFTENITIAVATLGNGTYVFSLAGQDVAGNYLYYVAGAFTVSGGVITTGEQDFVDYFNPSTLTDTITGGTLSGPDAAGNLTITLNTGDSAIGVAGVETLSVVMASSGTTGDITEFDSSASGSGELRLQSPPSGSGVQGYAFFLNGGDTNGNAAGFGGVVNVTGAGAISGAGSVFDLDDGGTLTTAAPIDSGTISAPDAFGRIQISLVLTTSGVGGIGLAGYIVDSSRTFLVENSNDPNDIFFGVTGGIAYAQGASTGTFNAASIEGTSFVFGTSGQNINNYLQIAGVVTTNVDGTTVSGTLNSNDLTGTGTQAPVPFTGTYTVDLTGRVTLSNLASTDGTTFSGVTLQLYLSGGSKVVVNAMDGADEWAGQGKVQTGGGSFTAGSLSGNYGLVTTGFGLPGGFAGPETDSVGSFTADGVSAFNPGAVDHNILFGAQTGDVTFTGAFSADPSGIFTGSITGLDVTTTTNADSFSYYLIDTTSGVAIETDPNQLTLGSFNLE